MKRKCETHSHTGNFKKLDKGVVTCRVVSCVEIFE
jgi:hypothetical protein